MRTINDKTVRTRRLGWCENTSLVLLTCVVIYTAYCILCHFNPWAVNPDSMNELLYRKLSWDCKTLFPSGYICGNESFSTRPVLLYWLYYGITGKFLLSYQLECISMYMLALAAFYWLLSEMQLSRIAKMFGLCCFSLFNGWLVVDFTQISVYHDLYSVFVLACIATLALRLRIYKLLKEDGKCHSKSIVVAVIILWVISALMGYGTVKLALFMYFPIFIVDASRIFFKFINDRTPERKDLVLSAITLIALLINAACYVVFLKIHRDFINPNSLSVISAAQWFDWNKLSASLYCLLYECGVVFGTDLLSFSGVKYVLTTFFVLIACVSTIQSIRQKEKWPVIEMCVSILIIYAITVVSTQGAAPRYFFIATLLVPASCARALNRWVLTKQKKVSQPICALVLLCVFGLFGCTAFVEELRCSQEPYVLASVADYIDGGGYAYVTAHWEYAAMITGYTEGRVMSQNANVVELTTGTWTINKNLENEERKGVPNILLLTDEEEKDIFSANNRVTCLLNQYAEKVQEIDQFNLYALDENPFTLAKRIEEERRAGLPGENVEAKTDLLSNWGFIFVNTDLDENGFLVTNGNAGGFYGPYTQSVPGTYDITFHYVVESYTHSDEGYFDVALDAAQIAAVPFNSEKTSVKLENVVIEGGHLFEVRMSAPEGMIVRVQSIDYERVDGKVRTK